MLSRQSFKNCVPCLFTWVNFPWHSLVCFLHHFSYNTRKCHSKIFSLYIFLHIWGTDWSQRVSQEWWVQTFCGGQLPVAPFVNGPRGSQWHSVHCTPRATGITFWLSAFRTRFGKWNCKFSYLDMSVCLSDRQKCWLPHTFCSSHGLLNFAICFWKIKPECDVDGSFKCQSITFFFPVCHAK